MNITFDSVVSTIIWTSLIFSVVFLCRRSLLFIRYFGVQSLLSVCCLLLFRLLIPLELSFVTVVTLPELLNPIKAFFNLSVDGITILTACIVIWVLVALVLLLRLVILFIVRTHRLEKSPHISTEQIDQVAREIIGDNERISVSKHHSITTPAIVYGRQTRILLPTTDYTDLELRFILAHEYAHFQNGDVYIRLFVELLTIVFWWNPFVYLMKFDLDSILEIKCDASVIKGKSEKEIIEYSKTLVRFSEEPRGKNTIMLTSEFSSDENLIQRFKLIFQKPKSNQIQKLLSALVGTIFMASWFTTYLYSFQSQYATPKDIEVAAELSISEKENTDGTYTVTFKDGSTFTVSENTKDVMLADLASHKE